MNITNVFSKKEFLKSNTTFIVLIFLSFYLLFLTSCHQKEKIIYFQGNQSSTLQNISYDPNLKPDDLLSIQVFGHDEATVKLFNIAPANLNQNMGGYSTGNPTQLGYLINSSGFIDFPFLGKIKLQGLNRQQAVDLLKDKLKPYLKDAVVTIRILNYKVTVLGEVKNPGTFTIPNERITLLEALGIAGDLQITALRNNILVLREIEGKLTETRIDLTKKDFFNSSVYYLQQNDVVYVEPNKAKINSALFNQTNVSTGISLISLIITAVLLFTRR
jgi:polysaccharide export outer membrane protein